MQPTFPGVFQYAYFVADIEQAAAQFAELLGAGPFFSRRTIKPRSFNIKGNR